MDQDTASQFVSCLVRCIQAFCHGYVQFSSSIEIVGHIYLNVDKGSRFNYIVNEEVSKNPGTHNTVYHTNSYHSSPPARDLLLKMSSHQEHGVESMPDNRGEKNKESLLDTTSSALPTRIEKQVSAAHPVSLIKVERAASNRLKLYSQNLPLEECTNKSLPLSSSSSGLPKERTHSRPPEEQETSYSVLNLSTVVKQEPEMPFFYEMKPETEDESLAADKHCEDDNTSVFSPHAPISPRRHGRADLPADCDSVSYETANSHPTKSLSVQIRQQIVAYANIVGNRPAARHFGVHESSIRHWRKRFGMISQSSGEKRGRKRKGDFLQDTSGQLIQASVLSIDISD